MFEAFIQGLFQLFTPINLVLLFAGVIFAIIIGVIPAIGSLFSMSILLPFLFGLKPEVALPLLMFVCAPSSQGGSITAILLNIPGDTVNAATLLDGFPMTKKGQAGRALGAALTASGMGGIVGAFGALATIPLVLLVVKAFGTPEQWALVLVGIAFVGILGGSVIKGCISGLLGLLIALIGFEATTATARFTFGTAFLYDGIGLLPLLLGMFAMPEMFEMAESGSITGGAGMPKEIARDIMEGVKDVFRNFWLFLRSCAVAFLIGIIPGIGPAASMFVSYGQAVRTSKHPERFGTGTVEGVIAPEASIPACLAGDIVPTIGFGIPGSSSMTLLLAGFIIVGIQPGPYLVKEQLPLCFSLVWAVALSVLLGALLCLLFVRYAVKVAYISADYLIPITVFLVAIGAFAYEEHYLDLVVLLGATGLGYLLKKFNYSRPALLLGFILGFIFERNLFISFDVYGPSFLLRPIVLVLLVIVAFVVAGRQIRTGTVNLVKLMIGQQGRNKPAPSYVGSASPEVPVVGPPTGFSWKGSTYFMLAILLLAMVTLILSINMANFRAQLLPLVFGGTLAVLSVIGLLAEIRAKPTGEHPAVQNGKTSVNFRVLAETAAWVISFVITIGLIGFTLASFLFVTAYLQQHHKGWFKSLVFGLVVAVICYVVFDFLLDVNLYQGVLYIPIYRFLP